MKRKYIIGFILLSIVLRVLRMSIDGKISYSAVFFASFMGGVVGILLWSFLGALFIKGVTKILKLQYQNIFLKAFSLVWVLIIISGFALSFFEETFLRAQNCREVEPIEINVDLKIIRTEQELFASQSTDDVIDYLAKYPELAYYFWHNHQYPNDSILAKSIFDQIDHPSVDTVYQESIRAFEDMDVVEAEFEEAFTRLSQIYPNAKTPKIYSAVSVFYNDLFISDSLIILGLDHFIGSEATYDPKDIPAYILKRYDRVHLPTMVMQFISGHYVRAGRKQTLLSDMIDFGKTYYLNSRLLPCTPDSILIGYSPQQMIDINSNREVIWANFIENQLLYQTDHFIKAKFLSERPNIYEIGEKCPGRIGAWIGWEIVESYMAKNNVSITELMDDTDHHKIFDMSGYKPRDK